jgi:hypothetical protein
LTIIKPPRLEEEEMSCETRTRVLRPLGGLVDFLELPHEMKVKVESTKTIKTRAVLFKPKAPNGMKNGDLKVKSWIIADRDVLTLRPVRHWGAI